MLNKHRVRRWASLLLLLAGLAGCGIWVQQPNTFGVSCAGSSTGAPEAPEATALAVPARVLHTATATLALIPVSCPARARIPSSWIPAPHTPGLTGAWPTGCTWWRPAKRRTPPVTFDGHDPMMFVLDTGSSTSVLDRAVAQRLSLPPIGPAQHVAGVSCGTATQPVHVDSWRVGTVPLPAQNLDGIVLAIPGLTGLLGSDVLYRFGTITADYAGGRLILNGTAP